MLRELCPGHFVLIGRRKILHRQHTRRRLILTQQQDGAREFVANFKRFLQPKAAISQLHAEAVAA
jgi:hypothetical protein